MYFLEISTPQNCIMAVFLWISDVLKPLIGFILIYLLIRFNFSSYKLTMKYYPFLNHIYLIMHAKWIYKLNKMKYTRFRNVFFINLI